MHFDIHGYDTGETGSMNVNLPTFYKEVYKIFFLYLGDKLGNDLQDFLKRAQRI